MDENSGNNRFNILKLVRNFLILAVLIFAMIIIIPVGGFFSYLFYSMIPPRDSVYIGYLEFYAGKSLPSCEVMRKKYDESYYTTAIYRVNDSDFEKVLKGVQKHEYLDTITPRDYNDVAIQLLRKEANCDISELDYSYFLFSGDTQFGFKRPDLILFFRRIYN